MKQISKNLFTYSAEIHADVVTLEERLPQFMECGEHTRDSYGFVPVIASEEETRVLTVPGGWVVCLRHDGKLLPNEALKKWVDERAAHLQQTYGRKIGKKERKELMGDAIHELLPQAFVRSRRTFAFYSERTQRLYVSTGSQKAADRMVHELVHSLESVKTSTVHVSEPKMGLTARLLNWLDHQPDDETFGDLHPEGQVVMKGATGKWSVNASHLREAEDTLREAMRRNTTVDSMGFCDMDGIKFRVTAALRIKAVQHRVMDAADDSTEHHQFVSQAADEIATLDTIVDTMLDLLSPEKAQAPKAAPAEPDNNFDDLF
ncbi:recombination-associated protein RdgC [Comamonas antarctica]|uniref:recombination-associated protein RdgC n=1 Tax=Comamonas antarctica TaxID=2743470 RepID=UPI0028E8439B|nr:recombination-associated protein RdgC [Comamonas antarctica]